MSSIRRLVLIFVAILLVANSVTAQRADSSRSVGKVGAGGSDHKITPRAVSAKDRAIAERLENALRDRYAKVTADRIVGRLSAGRNIQQALADLGVSSADATAAIATALPEGERLFIAAPAAAGFKEPLPDAPGDYEVAYSFASNVHPRVGENSKQRIPGNFWYAFSPWLSFEVDDDTAVSLRKPSAARVTGTGDVVLNLIPVLMQERSGPHPKILGTYALKLPTAESAIGLGTGYVDHSVVIEIQKHLGAELNSSVVVDVGNTWSGNANGYDPGANVTIKYRIKTPNPVANNLKVGFDGELDWNGPTGGDSAESYVLLGPRVVWADIIALRGGIRIGLTDNTPRVGLYVGFVLDGNVHGQQGIFLGDSKLRRVLGGVR